MADFVGGCPRRQICFASWKRRPRGAVAYTEPNSMRAAITNARFKWKMAECRRYDRKQPVAERSSRQREASVSKSRTVTTAAPSLLL